MWWIAIGAVFWVLVAMMVALLIGQVISHADLEDEAVALRRQSREPNLRLLR
ncbi:hypothetical protein [Gordonia rubripertincta]|uniref:Uncharacterized protein n=1 Tax=Gordonia rubripertincta TaxID=36822 RepID=A0ABT4MXR2_GORRU|nr:hypothetical protein [Gordonia rubripertincta]MCZ4551805.1 hypothetical protein [Gordonia rubripertincta]